MNELEKFLESVSGEGESGEFAIDRESAVAKISAHQIPYGGHWALKIIQAAVALGCTAIEVLQTRHKTVFLIAGTEGWDSDYIAERFWDIEPSRDRSLDHLKTALWRVGIHEKRSFELRLPGSRHSLAWNGESLSNQGVTSCGPEVRLEVFHQPVDSEDGWWARTRNARCINATVGAILAKRAFVCPVPLSLDGRRIDYLFERGHPGLGPSSLPVGFTFLREGEPKFRLDALGNRPREWWDRSTLGRLSEEKLEKIEIPGEDIWMAAIVVLHIGHRVISKTSYLTCRAGQSLCQWVIDGVVTERVVFLERSTPLSINCFVSGAGLATDMTTMSFHQNQEFKDRFRKVVQETKKILQSDWSIDLDPLADKERRRHQTEAVVFGMSGLILLPLPPLAFLVWWAARRDFRLSQETAEGAIEEALAGLQTLREEWAKLAAEWG